MGQSLFPLLRPAYERTPELATLASQARAENESSDALQRQIDFDDKVARELSSLKLIDSKADAFESLLTRPNHSAKAGTSKSDETARESPQSQSEAQAKEEEIEQEDEEEPTKRARPRTILFAVGVGLIATVCRSSFTSPIG
jgi:hypothetical protein